MSKMQKFDKNDFNIYIKSRQLILPLQRGSLLKGSHSKTYCISESFIRKN